ncbi:MAG: hypothetical protein HYS81_01855 [Candidatus Aenigmatarchaeota archaeon]|nr:MAG: hypothetical protein HYS81_01855 [Candidatus Aenigmarchaeota archaeon]
MKVLTREKRDLIKKFQEAVGNSPIRLRILKNISKKESVKELSTRLSIPQPTMSKAINRFNDHGYGLIRQIGTNDRSEIYEKVPQLKLLGVLDQWLHVDLREDDQDPRDIPRRIKPRFRMPSSIPFIDDAVEEDAQRMAEPYVILYLLENSLRHFIHNTLSQKYGADWWHKAGIRSSLLNEVKSRKALEGINKWHAPRGSHELFYTDLEDLVYIMRKEHEVFKNLLDLELWPVTFEKAVKLSRNIVDHHNPLPEREVKRLKQILEDWKNQFG